MKRAAKFLLKVFLVITAPVWMLIFFVLGGLFLFLDAIVEMLVETWRDVSKFVDRL